MTDLNAPKHNVMSRIVEGFLRGNLSVMLVIIALLLGAWAMMGTSREEDPQIVVPLADVYIQAPGVGARDVEEKVATRLEKMLSQIDGVEYVYSMSQPNRAIVTVRFYVGQDRVDSLVKIHNKLAMNQDRIPDIVTGWVVKPIEIDDVPVVGATLYSKHYSDFELRRMAEELEDKLQAVHNTARIEVVGGRRRQLRVRLDPERLAAHSTSPLEVARALRGANVRLPAGRFERDNVEVPVDVGGFLRTAADVRGLVVGVYAGSLVYLRDVAEVTDGAGEVDSYTRIGFGPSAEAKDVPASYADGGDEHCAVTIAVAKKQGTNAVWVARDVEKTLQELKETVLPDDVEVLVTRNYGETANDKVNELVEGLVIAVIIVIGLVSFTLGWREGLIVAMAVPITFGLTLFVNMMLGYTINRVTLFALILALGLVVDDPIVDVENIFRHFKMRRQPPMEAVLTAVNEVRPPIILATMAVIVSFVPMFFITGMMGPYMRPMALNVPMSMLMSLVVAFTITPWMTYHMMKSQYGKKEKPFDLKASAIYRIYRRTVEPLLDHRWRAWLLVGVIVLLMAFSGVLALTGAVPMKMLPFDNKNEFQIVVDMPEGTTLEKTAAAAAELGAYLQTVPEVTDYTSFVGLASPIDFNGLVRHYYMRRGSHVADIRINLVDKDHRVHQSHALTLRIRDDVTAIAARHGANIKLVEMPPGPPVIATLTAEVYGKPYHRYDEIVAAAKHVRSRLEGIQGVVDVDDTVEADHQKLVFVPDKEKASQNGVSTSDLVATLKMALGGQAVGTLYQPSEVNPLPIVLQLPRADRSGAERLKRLHCKGAGGKLVSIAELGDFQRLDQDKTIYHKNMRRVVYVFGETAGRAPAEAILDVEADLRDHPVGEGFRVDWAGEGEWKITLDVFRDLGIAFGAACIGIYMLLVYETGSYFMPLILMISIPLTIIGIMPGFWALNLLWGSPVGGYPNPVFFTATAMIGMIALAGIAVRNAILLIEFIHVALAKGYALKDAILESGAVRFRPIFLTAGTAMLAAFPIALDPIFSGLAWALIFGLFVSTAFTLVLIPVVYWMVYRKKHEGTGTDSPGPEL